jgi:hypothetical protein
VTGVAHGQPVSPVLTMGLIFQWSFSWNQVGLYCNIVKPVNMGHVAAVILPIAEILIPNSETRNNSQKLKYENGFVSPIWVIEPHLNLEFVSDFEFRSSNFHLIRNIRVYMDRLNFFSKYKADCRVQKRRRIPFYMRYLSISAYHFLL